MEQDGKVSIDTELGSYEWIAGNFLFTRTIIFTLDSKIVSYIYDRIPSF
jgi:hypothetical protein